MRGGKRAGAGRPKGEPTKLVRVPKRTGAQAGKMVRYLLSQIDALAGFPVQLARFVDGVVTAETGEAFIIQGVRK